MGYYPIKCIRCSKVTTNEHVLFDIKHAIVDMTGELAGNNSKDFVVEETPVAASKENTTKKSSIWDDDDETEDSVFETPNSGTSVSSLSNYMVYSDLQKFCENQGLDQCVPRWQRVDVTPDFANDDPEDLLVGVSFQKEKGGQVYRANRRFCPTCHCELPSQSGSMPTYNITVMGTSSSGKTVYLSALNWLLSTSQGTLPYRSELTCVSANKANADFVGKSNVLFERGVLPGTTQIVLTEPLVVQMTFRIANKMKKCLVSLADMRGEDLVAQDGENLIARGGFFSRADAFMVLVSPLNMPYIHNILPHADGETPNASVHQTLMSNISEYILPFFSNGAIAAPSVIMMSKCDILMNNATRLQIPLSNAVVAAEPPVKFTHTYFMNQDKGTQTIMRCDQALYSFLRNTFTHAYFTSFSSLGKNVMIEEDENHNQRISNPNTIRPIRVIDPIIYILMALGFLPKFIGMEAGPAFNESNVEILNKWVEERT